MENGLYEKILDNNLKKEIENNKYNKLRNIDNSEISRVVSITYQKIIREILSQFNSDAERVKLIEELNQSIGIGDFEYNDNKFKELIAIQTIN